MSETLRNPSDTFPRIYPGILPVIPPEDFLGLLQRFLPELFAGNLAKLISGISTALSVGMHTDISEGISLKNSS